MAKDKSSKDTSKIKGGVLLLTDEELETAEKRKDWAGGGTATLPAIGQHTATVTQFYPDGESTGKVTAGAPKFRLQVTLDDSGSRMTDFLTAHPSVAARLIKALETLDLKRVVKGSTGNELKLPDEAECEAKVGTKVLVDVVGYEDDYKQAQAFKAGAREEPPVQRPVWKLVGPAGSTNGKAAKGVNGKAEKQRIAR